MLWCSSTIKDVVRIVIGFANCKSWKVFYCDTSTFMEHLSSLLEFWFEVSEHVRSIYWMQTCYRFFTSFNSLCYRTSDNFCAHISSFVPPYVQHLSCLLDFWLEVSEFVRSICWNANMLWNFEIIQVTLL